MKSFKTHQSDVNQQVLNLLMKRVPAGHAVTDADWDIAYEIVLTMAIIEMIEWKMQNIDPMVLVEFNHGR